MINRDDSGAERPGLTEQARQRLRDELEILREQRRDLDGGQGDEDRANDFGDNAETLRRADDVARIDDRIKEITRLLAVGASAPGVNTDQDTPGGLADGTTVTLRFEDGSVQTLYAVAITEEVPEQEQDRALSLDSPLGSALAGRGAGDTIHYDTPDGPRQAEVVKLEPPN
jgi:transcription elongation GreA/GreB family factor